MQTKHASNTTRTWRFFVGPVVKQRGLAFAVFARFCRLRVADRHAETERRRRRPNKQTDGDGGDDEVGS